MQNERIRKPGAAIKTNLTASRWQDANEAKSSAMRSGISLINGTAWSTVGDGLAVGAGPAARPGGLKRRPSASSPLI